jgi:hypothetical protein
MVEIALKAKQENHEQSQDVAERCNSQRYFRNERERPKQKSISSCLTIEDGSKERLDCYDGIIPPDQKPKPPVAKRVADCKFLKEEDERLGCFNRFVQPAATPKAARKVAPKVQSPK